MHHVQQCLRSCRYLNWQGLLFTAILTLLTAGCSWVGLNQKTYQIIHNTRRSLSDEAWLTSGNFQGLSPLPVDTPASANTLSIVPVHKGQVPRYGLLELDLQTSLVAANPYNPNEVDLRVRFIAPSGREAEVGAFWYQGYDLQSRQPKGEAGWKVRFTPDEVGDWEAVAHAPGRNLQSSPYLFKVSESSQPGFIRVHPTNPHYLAFDNGDFFFPIGINMGWWGGCCDPLEQYDRWLDSFSTNGGNTIRVWMASWSFGIEWKDTGLGNYGNRSYEAWLLDQLFRVASSHRVKIILVLMNHGPLSIAANSEWADNPYNAALGGPLNTPEQFVTDPTAISYYQRRLNYIVNRWGYSPDLLAWEWFNEVNLTTISDEALIPWLQEMTAYLRQRDVNHHLMTNSFAMRTTSDIWQLPEMDIAQKHEYSSQINASDHDLAGRSAQDFIAFDQSIPEKPILVGEFGYSAIDYGDDVEKTGIHLHNGIWSTTFSGYAGSGMYWWWDIYVDANNLWHHYKGLSDFLSGEDLSQFTPFSPLKIDGPAGSPGQAVGLGLRGEKIMVWLRSSMYTVQASIAAQNGAQDAAGYTPPIVEGQVLRLNEIMDGRYTVYWYDPQAARWLEKDMVETHNHSLIIEIPPFRYDLAAKIIRNH